LHEMRKNVFAFCLSIIYDFSFLAWFLLPPLKVFATQRFSLSISCELMA
jgi:nitrate/nitrite transporter NarK